MDIVGPVNVMGGHVYNARGHVDRAVYEKRMFAAIQSAVEHVVSIV